MKGYKNGRPYTSPSQGVFEDGALLTDEPQEIQEAVLAWIKKEIKPGKKALISYSSYGIKHILQGDTGIYLSNNAMKDAMLMAGFEPVDPEEGNWHFCMSIKSKAFDRKSRLGMKRAEPHPAQVKQWEAVSNG